MSCHPTRTPRPEPAHWLEVRVGAGLSLVPASEDASFRRYFRVTGTGASRILMDAPPDLEDCRPFVRIARQLRAAGVHTPEILIEDVEHGYLLLEDLGDETYLQALNNGVSKEDIYRDAIETLVLMQGMDCAGLPDYDARLLHRELALFPEWFVSTHLGIEVPAWLADIEKLLVDDALAQPQVFVHRDYHSRNLMRVPQRNPGVLDFQDAVRGPVTYDFASLMCDAYVDWTRDARLHWLMIFRQRLQQMDMACGADEAACVRWVDWMGVQRQLKVAGIFARLHHRDGKPQYLADIPRTLRYARDAALRYPELAPLGNWLSETVLPKLEQAR